LPSQILKGFAVSKERLVELSCSLRMLKLCLLCGWLCSYLFVGSELLSGKQVKLLFADTVELSDGQITRQGFLQLNQMEAEDNDEDLWITLSAMGYNSALVMDEVQPHYDNSLQLVTDLFCNQFYLYNWIFQTNSVYVLMQHLTSCPNHLIMQFKHLATAAKYVKDQ